MGLDQYLYADIYVGGGWEHTRKSERPEDRREVARFDAILSALGCAKGEHTDSVSVHVQIGYWRKANHIHKWFVDNCADGNDDCRDTYVSRERLQELLDTCLKVKATARMEASSVVVGHTSTKGGPFVPDIEPGDVVANAEEIAAILPTQAGFFFGSTDYDQFYMADVDLTIAIVRAALAEPAFGTCDFIYRASW